ncbi:unnamed protein product, partial [Laminaria digitata]
DPQRPRFLAGNGAAGLGGFPTRGGRGLGKRLRRLPLHRGERPAAAAVRPLDGAAARGVHGEVRQREDAGRGGGVSRRGHRTAAPRKSAREERPRRRPGRQRRRQRVGPQHPRGCHARRSLRDARPPPPPRARHEDPRAEAKGRRSASCGRHLRYRGCGGRGGGYRRAQAGRGAGAGQRRRGFGAGGGVAELPRR